MGLKKNLIYNGSLTTVRYIFPLIIFPYITRVLGVEKIGIVNFVDSILTYSILFSTMGMNILGIREIAKNNGRDKNLNRIFTELFTVHAIFTVVTLIIYLAVILTIPRFSENKDLFIIGLLKIFFSLFLVEWFYNGIENFKYITIRSFLVQVCYLASLLFWVRKPSDFNIYFLLTCSITILNAMFNWSYAFKFISFSFILIRPKKYIKPFFTLGLYVLLTSLYTTLNTSYLGFVSSDKEVGYYSTALKFYYIILAIFSAFTSVMMPRMSSLLGKNDLLEFKNTISKSFQLTFTFSFPIAIFVFVLAPQAIQTVAGVGYEGAILPLRIMIFLVFVVGISQITAIQILIPMKKDSLLLKTAFIGAISGIILNIFFVKKYESIGSAIVLTISESIVTCVLVFLAMKTSKIKFPLKNCIVHILFSLPYLLIYLFIQSIHLSSVMTILISVLAGGVYFLISQVVFIKNNLIISLIKNIYKQ